jgi:hypothetical protein
LFARWKGKPKKEQTMPALLPVVLLTAVHLALPAGDVRNLNIMPGCQAAAIGSVGAKPRPECLSAQRAPDVR